MAIKTVNDIKEIEIEAHVWEFASFQYWIRIGNGETIIETIPKDTVVISLVFVSKYEERVDIEIVDIIPKPIPSSKKKKDLLPELAG